MSVEFPSLDPNETDFRVLPFCSRDGTNDGTASDSGELQGATISSHTAVAVDSSITVNSSNLNSVSWQGVTFSANTAVTVWVTGGTIGTNGEVLIEVVTSDSRTLQQTMEIPIRAS